MGAHEHILNGYSPWRDTKPTASTCPTAVDSRRQTSWSRISSWQAFGTSASTCPCVTSSTDHDSSTCATGKHHTPTPTARSMPQSRSSTTTSTATTSATFSSFPLSRRPSGESVAISSVCYKYCPTAKQTTTSHAWASSTPPPRLSNSAEARTSISTVLSSGSPSPRPPS